MTIVAPIVHTNGPASVALWAAWRGSAASADGVWTDWQSPAASTLLLFFLPLLLQLLLSLTQVLQLFLDGRTVALAWYTECLKEKVQRFRGENAQIHLENVTNWWSQQGCNLGLSSWIKRYEFNYCCQYIYIINYICDIFLTSPLEKIWINPAKNLDLINLIE